jgi:NAD(P)-dependent dehydrogenase (short-subunit alcohol dehydrogenase family)
MFRPDLLRGMNLIVSGGGTGLGRSMAKRYAELGARVVIASRNAERLETAAAQLRAETGAHVLPIPTDIRDPDACAHLVERTVTELGAVHGLMNNAAGNFLVAAEELSTGGFDAIVDIVLKGTWYLTQAVGRRMIRQGQGGSIVSILTTYVHSGSAFVLPSAMAKAGVLAMTKSLAVEWGSAYGIRLNAIAPGPFPTEGAWQALVFDAEAAAAEMKARIPLGRFGEHEELANLAAYLMAKESAYVNGQCIDIDGGEQLQGAGEFSNLIRHDRKQLKEVFQAMRKPKAQSEG